MTLEERTGKETMEFQAEVKQLLDIVVNSLYTQREIFLRELVSNAADALEKVRYLSLGGGVADSNLPLEIHIDADPDKKTLSVRDTGVGMTRQELVENLGTIAHSGSRAFLQHLAETDRKDYNLIGQFGVGFYSAFMVADAVTVKSRSYKEEEGACTWVSRGLGNYEIADEEGLGRGTTIIMELKEDAQEFSQVETIKRIIRQYSSFVPFPILVNGEKVNTVQALWTRNKSEITDEEYKEFYKYVANAFDEPLFRFHFSADAPLSIRALVFVPKDNLEKFGFGRQEPGVNLYCRKVLIQQQMEGLLPDWLRFLKGVVDSEEIPLNISRETLQDSAIIAKLRRVITGRFLKFLNEQSKLDKVKYNDFWKTFGPFIKEGAATDFTHREEIAKLLRFESSASEPGELISLEDYVARMQEEQKGIYYINGPSREVIEAGPYLEIFKARGIEVLYTHEPVDDFVLNNLAKFSEKDLVSADQAELNLPGLEKEEGDGGEVLAGEELDSLLVWLKEVLGDDVGQVKPSTRLTESPAVVLAGQGMMSGSMQRMMQMVHKELPPMPGANILEINTGHAIIKGLARLKEKDDEFARVAAQQIYDSALIAAGLVVDPRGMVNRMYRILERSL